MSKITRMGIDLGKNTFHLCAMDRRGRVVMTNDRLNRLLARHATDPAEMRALLNAKGYIWRDAGDRWTPGIPSLMDYMIEETAPSAPAAKPER